MAWTTYVSGLVAAGAAYLAYYMFSSDKTPKRVLSPDEFSLFPLIQKTVMSHNTCVYRFGLPRASDVLGLPIGQHVSVAANIDGKEIMRSYTPTSSDDDRGYFDLLIKAYPTGNISKHIAGLNIGDTIRVKGPKGKFNYHRGLCKTIGMVAGGTGITPMYQIIKQIGKDPEDNTEVNLIFANMTYEDILLKDELDAIAAANKNIHVHYVLDNPPENWTGGVGFVTSEMIKSKLPPPGPHMKLLLCGPPPMVSSIKRAVQTLGYDKARPVSVLEDQVFAF